MFLYITLFLVMLLYFFVKYRRSLHMLQQNLYNENNRYVKWVKNNKQNSFKYLDLLGIFVPVVMVFIKDQTMLNVILILYIAFYLYLSYSLVMRARGEQTKKPLVTTKRIQRLWVTLLIMFMIPWVVALIFPSKVFEMLVISATYIYLAFVFTYVANVINKPVEKMVFIHFSNMAKRKLKSMPNLKVVGITGSYGKTSSKNILNDILNIKYVSRPTPKNFNTYYGLMITINNHIDKFDDIFIAEMGAYTRGDIKGLCDLVHPKYGILTTIGTAHLESFGSEENIVKTKFELIESLPSDGVAILNMDDEKQVNYKLKNDCRKIWVAINNKKADYIAENIKCTHNGTEFDLVIKGTKEKYHFETKLLGNYSVYNILASLALGIEFGISIKDLQSAVRRVKPVEHRLELKKLGEMYQIDDAYNSNPVGAKMAIDVLGMMKGTKVVVTPGMIELGEKEDELNKIFGTQIADVADYVILVGEKKTKPIYDGLIEKGYDKDKIYVLNDVRSAYPLILKLKGKEDIYALFENDLPDTFNE